MATDARHAGTLTTGRIALDHVVRLSYETGNKSSRLRNFRRSLAVPAFKARVLAFRHYREAL